MRNIIIAFGFIFAILATACGASSKEVGNAKAARYKGDKLELFAHVKAAVESNYTLTKSDETSLGMQTESKWFSPEGMVVTRQGSVERGESPIPDNSVSFMAVVQLLPDGDAWIVKVTPVMERFHAGSPKPDPLKENDPSVPGWATDRVDTLAVDIHKALAKYEVKTVPGMAPPPAAPAEQAPPPPEQGSASTEATAPAAGSAAPQ